MTLISMAVVEVVEDAGDVVGDGEEEGEEEGEVDTEAATVVVATVATIHIIKISFCNVDNTKKIFQNNYSY